MRIPEPALILLVGPSGSGKSTFARAHFGTYEVVSSDRCRALVSDDEGDQSSTAAAFDVLHAIVSARLAHGRLTVVDATSVRPEARGSLLELARHHHLPSVAIVFDLPGDLCEARDAARIGRSVGQVVVRHQREQLSRSLPVLEQEGFAHVHRLRSPAEVEAVAIVREPLPTVRVSDTGPFDVIGDVHGCGDELEALLGALGYAPDPSTGSGQAQSMVWRHPDRRRLIFLGDLVDRGPRVVDVLRLAMTAVRAGVAFAVPGNHDAKLARKLRGRNVVVAHGLAVSLEQLAAEPPEFSREVADFIEGLPSHLVLDDWQLVVAHAGMRASLQGRESVRVRDFALYGETTGRLDEHGLPIRGDWAASYQGAAHVVYGHTPVAEPQWVNRTIDIDTGCVFGGRLTALRWPERALVSVPARLEYATSRRPFLPEHSRTP